MVAGVDRADNDWPVPWLIDVLVREVSFGKR